MAETITQDDAEDIAVYGMARIAVQDVSEHRWYTKQLVVFEPPRELARDGLYGLYYLKPKSEVQEDQDRFEACPVPVFPVVGEPVTTTHYRPAGATT